MSRELRCLPVTGVPEVVAGVDLAGLLAGHADLQDGDVLVVTSKVVSKAEGRVTWTGRDEAVAAETRRVVARRAGTAIVRTRLGPVLAAAGVDASNTPVGSVVLLPVDPDGSARRLREHLADRTGHNVAVVVSDTTGRPWRHGQTDIALGAAGIDVVTDHAGLRDRHGNRLSVTAPAVADELAATGDLVMGKLDGVPAAVVRGLGDRVLPSGRHGPGAASLVREESSDMFGYGAREAVLAAVGGDPGAQRGFGAPAEAEDVADALDGVLARTADASGVVEVDDPTAVTVALSPGSGPAAQRAAGRVEARLCALAFAMGWSLDAAGADRRDSLRFRQGAQ